MKIVHLIDYFQPTLGYQETSLAKEQLRLGYTVTVITSLPLILLKLSFKNRLLVDDHMHRVNVNKKLGGRLFYGILLI